MQVHQVGHRRRSTYPVFVVAGVLIALIIFWAVNLLTSTGGPPNSTSTCLHGTAGAVVSAVQERGSLTVSATGLAPGTTVQVTTPTGQIGVKAGENGEIEGKLGILSITPTDLQLQIDATAADGSPLTGQITSYAP